MVDHKADVNATNKKNETALILAYVVGNISAMTVLLNTGPDLLLKAGDLKASAYNGNSWLHCAVYGKCRKTVLQAIIDQGADVNETNMDNKTPLMIACENNDIDAINVLLIAGAKPDIVDGMGDTLLHNAVRKNIHKETLQLIIDYGAYVNAVNNDGATALILACTAGQRGSLNVLLKAGADTFIVDVHGDTCLHKILHRECDQEALHLLLDYGVPVNATNKNHQTAYMLACHRGNTDAMCALENAGAGLFFWGESFL